MARMDVIVNKDAYGFPSIVTITKRGRTIKVTTNPDQGFTIEGPMGLLPDFMDAFRVILPRVSYQKEVDVVQGEEVTEVSNNTTSYVLKKTLGVLLSASHTVDAIIFTLKAENAAETSTMKVTYQLVGASETTWFEQTTSSTSYETINKTIHVPLTAFTIFRVYLKNSVAGHNAYNKQLTLIGDNVNLVGHLF